jgi:hypothetical protein
MGFEDRLEGHEYGVIGGEQLKDVGVPRYLDVTDDHL